MDVYTHVCTQAGENYGKMCYVENGYIRRSVVSAILEDGSRVDIHRSVLREIDRVNVEKLRSRMLTVDTALAEICSFCDGNDRALKQIMNRVLGRGVLYADVEKILSSACRDGILKNIGTYKKPIYRYMGDS